MSELSDELTKAERELRNRFVEQYLTDYDEVSACIRLGYQSQFAESYAKKFMLESYTLNRIAEREQEIGLTTDGERHRKRVVSGLYREANSRFNTGSARVAALTQIAKITGIEAPAKVEQKVDLTATSPQLAHLSIEDLEEIKRKLYANPA